MDDRDETITLTITRSAGRDGVVLVLIDTTFEPDAADGGPGLRVLVNDDSPWAGHDCEPAADGEPRAPDRMLTVALAELGGEGPRAGARP
jgi:hypothetical protein